jgi:hypothetical protein
MELLLLNDLDITENTPLGVILMWINLGFV